MDIKVSEIVFRNSHIANLVFDDALLPRCVHLVQSTGLERIRETQTDVATTETST